MLGEVIERAFAKRAAKTQNRFEAFAIEDELEETNHHAVALSDRKPQQGAGVESHAPNAATTSNEVGGVVTPCAGDTSGSRLRPLPPTD